ncbi:hypothetical protein CPB85DRAFT_510258 [Mucidula mucida]|nr:hypothetical protein CPB85DRAFT_510258 [Mucidula mucida]
MVFHLFGTRPTNPARDAITVSPYDCDSVASLDTHNMNTPDTNRPLRSSSLYALLTNPNASVLSMSSIGSGGSSGGSRRRRPPSPVSMYLPSEFAAPKPPKPLVKIEKKTKRPQTSSSSTLSSSLSSTPSHSPSSSVSYSPNQNRSRSSLSLGPLLQCVSSISLRRKPSAAVALEKMHVTPSSPPDTPTSTSSLQRRLRQLDKATRMLGENIPAELVLGAPTPPSRPTTSPSNPSLAHSTRNFSRPKTAPSPDSPRSGVEPWLVRAPPSTNPHHPRRRESISWFHSPKHPDEDANYPQADSFPAGHSRGDWSTSHGTSSHHQSSSVDSKSSFVLPYVISGESTGEVPLSTTMDRHERLPYRDSTTSEVVFHVPAGLSDDEPPSPISFGLPSPIMLSHRSSDNEIVVTAVDEPNITLSPAPTLIRNTPGHTPNPSMSSAFLLQPSRPETPFLHSTRTTDSDAFIEVYDGMSKAARKERRQGWSGEWNRDNMQDVIAKLRMLR